MWTCACVSGVFVSVFMAESVWTEPSLRASDGTTVLTVSNRLNGSFRLSHGGNISHKRCFINVIRTGFRFSASFNSIMFECGSMLDVDPNQPPVPQRALETLVWLASLCRGLSFLLNRWRAELAWLDIKTTLQEMSTSCFQFLWPTGFILQFYLRDPSLVHRGAGRTGTDIQTISRSFFCSRLFQFFPFS